MCIIAWNWQPNSDNPLLLLANRDEFYDRPALAAHWWHGGNLLAGKDLQGGGSWLGVNQHKKMAVLTNYRDPQSVRTDSHSRGELVCNFLHQNIPARVFLEKLKSVSEQYNPFNLLLYDGNQLLGFESRKNNIINLDRGIGILSNADFFSNWPKYKNLKNSFSNLVKNSIDDNDNYFSILRDENKASDLDLPDTGLPLNLERELSSVFVRMPAYGTRASTIIKINKKFSISIERSYNYNSVISEVNHNF